MNRLIPHNIGSLKNEEKINNKIITINGAIKSV